MAYKMNDKPLEIWGGIECTINRIDDRYFDQLIYSGHYSRTDDIEEFAKLGISALRYPVLWERHEPVKGTQMNWPSTEKNLQSIRANGINPIIGLVHHGSGPSFTNLLAEDFAEGLAAHAGRVAERFPWIEYYTPVNEPLTTARFSGLYGYWYPHHRSDISFVRMLLNQLKATILSMKAIRKINPDAKLVQTEDLGKTYSTPSLSFQSAFENERRWLTYDILCGRLKTDCLMYKYFLRLGILKEELDYFIENPCLPDILGANYYITSERFLDEDISKYPESTHGGNEIQQYADVEAIRVNHKEPWGLKVLVREAWERFHLPVAITENHINCTREEQLRWFIDSRNSLLELQEEGIDIRAITAWALLGAFGWDRLLTSETMNYELGVFDIRSGEARPTALAKQIEAICSSTDTHPFSSQPGWWHRTKAEYLHGEVIFSEINKGLSLKSILIVGKTGTLGKAFARLCKERHIPFFLAGREDADITNPEHFEKLLGQINPWAVINAAGFVKIDEAEWKTQQCYSVNTAAPVLMATLCARHSIKFMTFSTDQVFDGEETKSFYSESDHVNPLNIYGASKAMAEQQVLVVNSTALVIRTSAFFGPWDKANFPTAVVDSLMNNRIFFAAGDVFVTPTYVPDLVNESLDLLIDEEVGIWHLSNGEGTSWARFAKDIARRYSLDTSLIQVLPATRMKWVARRPYHAILGSEKGMKLPTLDSAIERFIKNNHELMNTINDPFTTKS